jgi:hypothetical protein
LIETLLRAAQQADEARQHIEHAARILADDRPITQPVADRVERELADAHTKTTKAKQGVYRASRKVPLFLCTDSEYRTGVPIAVGEGC